MTGWMIDDKNNTERASVTLLCTMGASGEKSHLKEKISQVLVGFFEKTHLSVAFLALVVR